MNDKEPANLPLRGIRVLELCHTIMGPSAGLLLAELGADVIKIEPVEGDRTRRLSGFAAGFFGTFNRNKRSLAIDLKAPAGRDLLLDLAAESDVIMENFAPGTMERLGLADETLKARNGGLIYCSLKGFLSGPYEHRPALDEVVQFMGGLAYMTGPPGRPLRAGTSVIDIMGGTFAVVAVLAALAERARTGRGQSVKSALFESTTFLMAQHMAGTTITGRSMPPMPAREGAWGIYEPFETADGQQIFIGITSDNHWRRFCEAFKRPDLLEDPRYTTNEDRVRERPTLLAIVAGLAKRRNQAELESLFDAISIPFAPVATPDDLFGDPHLQAGGRLLDVELQPGLRGQLAGLPFEMESAAVGTVRRQPPRAGEHSREILGEYGFEQDTVDALIARGVIRQSD
ncbi:MAG: CoA transferase [Gammaproteobacteria bacterium]|nr:CoA transferase [Gammaproteobacteria bacterium]